MWAVRCHQGTDGVLVLLLGDSHKHSSGFGRREAERAVTPEDSIPGNARIPVFAYAFL